jgi:hypothetical protein
MSSTLEFSKIVQKSNRHKRRSLEIREVFFLYIPKAMKVSKFGAKIWIYKHFLLSVFQSKWISIFLNDIFCQIFNMNLNKKIVLVF